VQFKRKAVKQLKNGVAIMIAKNNHFLLNYFYDNDFSENHYMRIS